jgi:hypothetical protein
MATRKPGKTLGRGPNNSGEYRIGYLPGPWSVCVDSGGGSFCAGACV